MERKEEEDGEEKTKWEAKKPQQCERQSATRARWCREPKEQGTKEAARMAALTKNDESAKP